MAEKSEHQTKDLRRVFMNEVGRIPLLTKEEEYELAVKSKAGDKLAKKKLIEANLRLAFFFAKFFSSQKGELSFGDLVQEAFLGLIRGVGKFDPERGKRLSAYVRFQIQAHVRRAIKDGSRTVRTSRHVWRSFNVVQKQIREFIKINNREPTKEELMEATGFKEKDIEVVSSFSRYGIVSLDSDSSRQHYQGGTTGLAERLIYQDTTFRERPTSIEDHLVFQSKLDVVLEAMEKLTPQEQEILERRFGLGDDDSHTLQEVGDVFGLTRQRICQIQESALQKIRDSVGAEKGAGLGPHLVHP